jgi:hypothetical protein
MQANPAAASLSLANVQFFLDGLHGLLLRRLTPARPLLGPRLDVDDRLTLHHLTGLSGAVVLHPGDNETETVLQALRVKLSLVLRDAGFDQLTHEVRAVPSIAQQARGTRAALAGQHADLVLRDPQGGELLCRLLRLLVLLVNCY